VLLSSLYAPNARSQTGEPAVLAELTFCIDQAARRAYPAAEEVPIKATVSRLRAFNDIWESSSLT